MQMTRILTDTNRFYVKISDNLFTCITVENGTQMTRILTDTNGFL